MAAPKSSFLDRVLERIRRLDPEGLQTVVQRLARERTFLETLFNTIEDGVLVADETGRILYVNQAVTRLLGLDPATAEGESVQQVLPELDWPKLARFDKAGGKWVSRHEFDISYPCPRLIHLYAAPLDGEAIGSSGVALILARCHGGAPTDTGSHRQRADAGPDFTRRQCRPRDRQSPQCLGYSPAAYGT
jgi:PAS domain-containing protein